MIVHPFSKMCRVTLFCFAFTGLFVFWSMGIAPILAADTTRMTIVNNGTVQTENNVFVGENLNDPEALIVDGEGSKLIVNSATNTTIPTLDSPGSVVVTDQGTIEMTDRGKIAVEGDVLFDDGHLTQTQNTVFDAGNGNILFDHNSVVSSRGTITTLGDVSVQNGAMLGVRDTNGVLRINSDDLTFGSNAKFGVTINKSGQSGQLDASGITNDVNLDGKMVVTPEYGYYGTSPMSFTVISNANNIVGGFANYELTQTRLGTVGIDAANSDATKLAILFNPSATPFSTGTKTYNERSVGQTFDVIHQNQIPAFAALMPELAAMNDTQLMALYNQYSGEIKAETMLMAFANPAQQAFDRVGWDSQYGHVFFGPQYRLAARGSRHAVWLRPHYGHSEVDSDGNASEYMIETYGFTGGIDQTMSGGKTAVGLMIGYGRPELEVNRDRANLDDFVVGAYLASRLVDAFEVKVWGGYGYQYYDMNRRVEYLGTPQELKSSFKGNTGTASAEIAMPIYTNTRLVLKPTVSYDYFYLTQKGADENGNSIIGLSYDKTSITRHIGRAGLSAEYGNSARSLYGGVYYKHLLGGDRYYYSEASFLGGGPSFNVRGVDLGRSFISANLGFQINLSDDRSRMIFGDYNADFGDHNALFQTVTVGFQQTF